MLDSDSKVVHPVFCINKQKASKIWERSIVVLGFERHGAIMAYDSITCYNQVVNIKDYLKKYLMWSAETTCQVLDITKLSGDK